LYSLDVDELAELSRRYFWFGYNRFNLAAIHDSDYLWGEGTLRQRVESFLLSKGIADKPARIQLVTSARHLGYAFNPASLYFCFSADGSLLAIVVEVNNTFGEKHPYLLNGPEWEHQREKEFHVSPFNDMQGGYRFRFADVRQRLAVTIVLERDGEDVLTAQLNGEKTPFGAAGLAGVFATAPFTMLRILMQAGRLYFGKQLRYYPKPPRRSAALRYEKAGRLERLAGKLVMGMLSKLTQGTLTVRLPDLSEKNFGHGTPWALLEVRKNSFFTSLLFGGDVGFGEAYTEGEWDSPNPVAVLQLLIANLDRLADQKSSWSLLGRWKDRLYHAGRVNTRRNSKKNIHEHYDLSNAFFQTFLDPSMTYSCGIFDDPADSLEQAQRNKIRSILDKAQIRPEHHILEIGSGWGGLAIEAVRSNGCRVTTITLSQQQLELARQRVEQAGMSDRIEVRLIDYRDMSGQFDRIVSVEMLEAVGHEYLGTFFAACDRLLAPGGRLVLQVITIPDQRYENYRRSVDWMRRYIFPGGHLPSLTALCEAMTKDSRFTVEELQNIGPHYARTLHLWRENCQSSREKILGLGFDERFLRMWQYYLMYCEAGFASRIINTLQIVLTRPGI
jgi:cyclopropane-fatty-acyl-phospholipid synthase